jgi:ribose 5-phosphate isomerase B
VRVGIASDHGGFVLKEKIADLLRNADYEVTDFGALQPSPGDDYPDYVIPLAKAVAAGKVDRGLALCGSGVGASICSNKVAGVCAGLIHDVFSAHQGVEDDDMNVFSLGGQVIGPVLAWELIETFLKARFSGAIRHQRRVAKVTALEVHEAARWQRPGNGPEFGTNGESGSIAEHDDSFPNPRITHSKRTPRSVFNDRTS